MKSKSGKKESKTIKRRNKYSIEQKEKALKYYLMGLNLSEISKLLDGCPVRTIEKWQQERNWTSLKNTENIKVKTKELHESGKSYLEIAEILKISRVTVWRYIKEAKELNDV